MGEKQEAVAVGIRTAFVGSRPVPGRTPGAQGAVGPAEGEPLLDGARVEVGAGARRQRRGITSGTVTAWRPETSRSFSWSCLRPGLIRTRTFFRWGPTG
jgi:hypothetical protein